MIQKLRLLLSVYLLIGTVFAFSGIAAVTLSNSHMRLGFDESTGALIEACLAETGFNLVLPHANNSLWHLLRPDGTFITPEDACSFSFTKAPSENSVEFLWKGFDDPRSRNLEVQVSVTLPENKQESHWNLALHDSDDFGFYQIAFPRMTSLAAQKNEALAVPFWMGEVTSSARELLNPADAPALRRSWEYPGLLSLQCLTFYGDQGGLMLSTRDSTAIRREFAVFGGERNALGIEISHPVSPASANYQLSGDVLLSLFTGDWFDAALLYRRERDALPYAEQSRVRTNQIPDWAEETGLWIWNRDASPGVLSPAAALQKEMAALVSVFWHWWHGCAYDAGFPEYLPPREGAESFKHALGAAQKEGIHAIVYMNQRLWGMDTTSWKEKDAQRYAVKGADGTIRREIYNTFTQSPCASMCMGTSFWRNTYAEIAEKVLLELGADGIYMDQACSSLACYDQEHPHPPGGGPWWMQGFQQLASDIRQRCLPVKAPVLAGEGCGEAWLPHLDLMLSLQVSLERYAAPGQWEPIPFFHAVYHDCARFFGNYCSLTRPPYDSLWPKESAPDRPLALLDKKFAAQFRLEQGRSFIWGQIPCIANFLPEQLTSRREELSFLKTLVHLRLKTLKYLRDGIMLAPPDIGSPLIEIPTSRLSIYAGQHDAVQEYTRLVPSVLAAAWQASDGNVAVALVNIGDSTEEIELSLESSRYPLGEKGKVRRITADTEEEMGLWTQGQALHALTLEGSSLAVVEYLCEMEP